MPPVSDPNGGLIRYGTRWTYFPPSIHQRPNQCTMTAAVMGANIALAGTITATPDEAVALARDSGTPVLPPHGYTTDHMLTALRTRYGLDLFSANVPIEAWRRRLGNRGAAIIAVHYPDLPAELQALAPGFQGGHRMLVVGYDAKQDTTNLMDPLRPAGRDRGTE